MTKCTKFFEREMKNERKKSIRTSRQGCFKCKVKLKKFEESREPKKTLSQLLLRQNAAVK